MKCFVSSIHNIDVNEVLILLKKRKIDYQTPFSIPMKASIHEKIIQAIENSDFLIGVISPSMSPNVILEIGIAVGLKKPIFLVSTGDSKNIQIPFSLNQYIIVNIRDHRNLELLLDGFLENIGFSFDEIPTEISSKTKHNIEISAFVQIENFQNVSQLSREIEKIFEQSDFNVKAEITTSSQRRADIVVWLKETGLTLGNPLIIESKINLSKSGIKESADQIKLYMGDIGSKVGLIISNTIEENLNELMISEFPFIVYLSFSKLKYLVKSSKFEEYLIEKRNQLAHGGSLD